MSKLIKCPHCSGIGFRNITNYIGPPKEPVREKCIDCEGTGKIEVGKCKKKKEVGV